MTEKTKNRIVVSLGIIMTGALWWKLVSDIDRIFHITDADRAFFILSDGLIAAGVVFIALTLICFFWYSARAEIRDTKKARRR